MKTKMTGFFLATALTFGFGIAVPAVPAVAGGAPAGWEPVSSMLAGANAGAGQKLAGTVCIACHSLDKGGVKKMGPNLYGIVNNDHAHMEGFAYSDAMKALHDKKWTYEALDQFLFSPKESVPGTKMFYPGIKKAEDRAALIAYLRTLADKPAALPKQ